VIISMSMMFILEPQVDWSEHRDDERNGSGLLFGLVSFHPVLGGTYPGMESPVTNKGIDWEYAEDGVGDSEIGWSG